MKNLLGFVLLGFPITLCAAEWTPPENAEPGAILQEAQDDAKKGDYETALAKHVWYHENALKLDESSRGVRLSFALGYWESLGKKYKPALERLRKVRDQVAETVLNKEEKAEVAQQAFQDLAAINEQLGEQPKTAELFLEVDKKNAALAPALYHFAQPGLLNAKEYEICGKYVDPDAEFKQISSLYEIMSGMGQNNPSLLARANDTLTNNTSYLVALLAVTDKKEKATEIAASAKKLRDDKRYHQSLDNALEGKFPKSAARFP
jgi:hypothetical protein